MMASTIASNRDYRPVLGGICFSWFYSLAWTVPPLLGWSRYGPEGPGTTCSVDWRTQTPNNISYIVCLFTFCLLLPFCVILYSYGKLLCIIRQVSRALPGSGVSRQVSAWPWDSFGMELAGNGHFRDQIIQSVKFSDSLYVTIYRQEYRLENIPPLHWEFR